MPKGFNPISRLDRLYTRGITILHREIDRLYQLSIAEKLQTAHAKDLRDYMKLMVEMREGYKVIEEEKALAAKKAAEATPDAALLEAIQAAPAKKPFSKK